MNYEEKTKDSDDESSQDEQEDVVQYNPEKSNTKYNYRNTTLKAVRAILCRHYKETHCIDIINNKPFIVR